MKIAANRNVSSRGILWFGSVAMLFFTAFMAFFFNETGWHIPQMVLIAVCSAITSGLVLTLVNASRFWWGMRVVTSIIFAVSFWYVVDQGFIHRHASQIGDAGAASLFNAVRCFLLFGLPSLLYTLWGSTWGKLGAVAPRNITTTDVLILKLAAWGRWLFLGMTLLVLAALLVRS
jgi:hypothetical protein